MNLEHHQRGRSSDPRGSGEKICTEGHHRHRDHRTRIGFLGAFLNLEHHPAKTVVNTKQKYFSIFRPRRFGKTMAIDMLCAYYDRTADSQPLFERLIVSEQEKGNDLPWDIYLENMMLFAW